ncbi:MAG: nucleotidyltransferase family protein [Gammaproteobacteria bacterium]|nr:nucleotidyltransferase family protein [Gammaproteobacteria bacterium]
MNKNIIGILLAAGHSTRFGGNKLLQPLPVNHIPMAVQSALLLLEALPNGIAVIRKDDQQLKSLLLETGIAVVENQNAHEGMSSSIRCGIESQKQLFSGAKGWVIALADMPYISATVIQQVANALREGALAAAPQFKNQRGHPVGFSYQLKDELLRLQGDAGAKTVLAKHHAKIRLINVSSNSILRDIDYPEDLIREISD